MKHYSFLWGLTTFLIPYITFGQDKVALQSKMECPVQVAGAEFGTKVALSDSYALISAAGLGRVYLFINQSGQWDLVKTFEPDAEVKGYGRSLAISGDVIAIGAPENDVEGVEDAGTVFIYHKDFGGANNWGQVAKIFDGVSPTALDQVGYDISIDGDYLAVSIPGDEFSDIGEVWIFKRSGDSWSLIKEIKPENPVSFGRSIALHDSVLVVGDRHEIVPDCNSSGGSASIFYQNEGGSENWGLIRKICVEGDSEQDFGFDVAIFNQKIIVGIPNYINNQEQSGAFALFEQNEGGPHNWGHTKLFTHQNNIDTEDRLGYAVAINDDYAIAGAPRVTENNPVNEGQVFCQSKDFGGNENSWGHIELSSSFGELGDRIGHDVDVTDNFYLVGAPNAAEGVGVAYILRNCYVPEIIGQPYSQVVCEGSEVNLNVDLKGKYYYYQWYKFDDQLVVDHEDSISGAQTNKLVIKAGVQDQGEYYCKIWSDCSDPIYSNIAQIDVTPLPSLKSTMENIFICKGESLRLQSNSAGPDLTYQWYKNGEEIPGEVNDNLYIDKMAISDEATYNCRTSNSCGMVDDFATVLVIETIQIDQQAEDITYCEGETVNFSINTQIHGLAYQWYKDGVPIIGVETKTYTIQSVSIEDEGRYSCIVSGSCDEPQEFNIRSLTVHDIPEIFASEQTISEMEGESIVLSANAFGDIYQYNWLKNGIKISDNQRIVGSATSTLSIDALLLNDAGVYTCQVIGACGFNQFLPNIIVTVLDNPEIVTSVAAFDQKTVSVYPNPNNGKFYWNKPKNIEVSNVFIHDIFGNLIFEFKIVNNLNTYHFDLSLSKGVYFLTTDQQQNPTKFIVH